MLLRFQLEGFQQALQQFFVLGSHVRRVAEEECSGLVLGRQLFEFLPQLVKVLRGGFHLLGSGHVLHAGLLDAFHRHRDLIGADQLLLLA